MKTLKNLDKTLEKIGKWICGDDTGASSLTLCATYLGAKLEKISVPSDPSDFGRCYRFLKLVPQEEMAILYQLGKNNIGWNNIHRNWEKLCRLWEEERKNETAPKLYEFMKSLEL